MSNTNNQSMFSTQTMLIGCIGAAILLMLFALGGWFIGQVVYDSTAPTSSLQDTLANLATGTPTLAATSTTQVVDVPAPPLPTATPNVTATPTAEPLGQDCTGFPPPGNTFAIFWEAHRSQLGCPIDNEVVIPTIAEELFQGGHMFWRSDTDEVYIVYDENNITQGDWERNPIDRKWDGSNPDGIGLNPPPGFVEPKRGFGWLWRTHLGGPDSRLGWALDKEYGFDNLGQAQRFEAGLMFKGSAPRLYVLLDSGRFYAR